MEFIWFRKHKLPIVTEYLHVWRVIIITNKTATSCNELANMFMYLFSV
jgi:hypothetical protein